MEVLTRPKLLYPSMVIAAIAVTVFSLLGIATLTGALPFAHSETRSSGVQDPAGFAAEDASESEMRSVQKTAAGGKMASINCSVCGVVVSVRPIEVKSEGSGIGLVAGGVTGALVGNNIGNGNGRTAATVLGAAGGAYAGNEIEKNIKKRVIYRVRVRMNDDTIRTVNQRQVPAVSAGDRVKIVDGTIIEQS